MPNPKLTLVHDVVYENALRDSHKRYYIYGDVSIASDGPQGINIRKTYLYTSVPLTQIAIH